jgi:hypothetical protein
MSRPAPDPRHWHDTTPTTRAARPRHHRSNRWTWAVVLLSLATFWYLFVIVLLHVANRIGS